MGAVLNMRPDLFNAAIMGVPFVDVVTTMMDESIPLTNIEWEEWGNPTVSHVLLGSLPAALAWGGSMPKRLLYQLLQCFSIRF